MPLVVSNTLALPTVTTKKAFTLIELLIVVAIVALLVIGGIFTLRSQRDKAENAKVKSDIHRLQIAFEEYHADHNCYPPAAWFDDAQDCESEVFKPYLNSIMCEKKTGLPYVLETDPTGCKWYTLTGEFSSAEEQPNCEGGPCVTTVYKVGSSNISPTIPTPTPSPTPTPTPTPTPSSTPNPNNPYYCQGLNNCSSYNTSQFNCSPNYPDPFCGNDRCATTVSTCAPL